MKIIEIGRKSYQVAQNWDELAKQSPEKYKQLIMCPRLTADGSYETLDHEAAACCVWLGMSPKLWASLELAHWQWGQLRQEFNWLFTTQPEGKPPIDTFFHKGVNYHLPAENFDNTSAVELAFANMAYLAFANPEDPDKTSLDKLIATLCRPRRADWRKFQNSREWNGDVREPFSEQRMVENAKALASLELNTKILILDYFERMNGAFVEQYGELFGGSKEPRYGDGRGWLMLIKNVAKEGHFGDFDKVCQISAHLLFASLLDDMLDREEATEASKDQTA